MIDVLADIAEKQHLRLRQLRQPNAQHHVLCEFRQFFLQSLPHTSRLFLFGTHIILFIDKQRLLIGFRKDPVGELLLLIREENAGEKPVESFIVSKKNHQLLSPIDGILQQLRRLFFLCPGNLAADVLRREFVYCLHRQFAAHDKVLRPFHYHTHFLQLHRV
ncbi:hypothetical protein SDC9_122347 [bioreactor metagenome]|uniref:Uncharacterized protein n=1 Tax=bioreactor metagenome TaxID=1076179 RepID=A0A645CEM7_9ZZZZ